MRRQPCYGECGTSRQRSEGYDPTNDYRIQDELVTQAEGAYERQPNPRATWVPEMTNIIEEN
jgi:hypothetical protein